MATKKKSLKKPAAPKVGSQPNQAQAKTTPQPDPSALSIGDLKNLATTLDVASTRGAFRANELATVGLLYNKLNQFLLKVAPVSPEGQSLASNPTTPAQPGKKE